MTNTTEALGAGALVTAAMIALVVARPRVLQRTAGRGLAFVAFFVLPLLVTWGGAASHLQGATSTGFCLSCHEMEPYGRSLHIDDKEHLPAVHWQNRLVPRDRACFTCHTEYTLFGGARSKLRGLKHVYVHYLGTPPAEIKLYEPYSNRECLHCHEGARRFEELDAHREQAEGIRAGTLSCLECHEAVHATDELSDLPSWSPPPGEGK